MPFWCEKAASIEPTRNWWKHVRRIKIRNRYTHNMFTCIFVSRVVFFFISYSCFLLTLTYFAHTNNVTTSKPKLFYVELFAAFLPLNIHFQRKFELKKILWILFGTIVSLLLHFVTMATDNVFICHSDFSNTFFLWTFRPKVEYCNFVLRHFFFKWKKMSFSCITMNEKSFGWWETWEFDRRYDYT